MRNLRSQEGHDDVTKSSSNRSSHRPQDWRVSEEVDLNLSRIQSLLWTLAEQQGCSSQDRKQPDQLLGKGGGGRGSDLTSGLILYSGLSPRSSNTKIQSLVGR